MILHKPRLRTLTTNSLFACLFLALFGSGLLQAWALKFAAGALAHALLAIPGAVLGGLALYRYRRHWPAGGGAGDTGTRGLPPYAALGGCLLLAATGFSFSLVIARGGLFLSILAMGGLLLVPWTRLPLCRAHFFTGTTVLLLSAASGSVALAGPATPLHGALAASFMLALAAFMHLCVIATHGKQGDRMPPAGYACAPPLATRSTAA